MKPSNSRKISLSHGARYLSKLPNMHAFNNELNRLVVTGRIQDNVALSARELCRMLTERYSPPVMARERRRKAINYSRYHWRRFLDPLKQEMLSVRSGITHHRKKKQFEFVAQYEEYLHVLQTYMGKFRVLRDAGLSLSAARQRLRDAGHTIENDGTYWTDWINAKTKDAMRTSFAARLPARSRVRVPFERRTDREVNEQDVHNEDSVTVLRQWGEDVKREEATRAAKDAAQLADDGENSLPDAWK